MRGKRKFQPRCIDCGATDPAKFYSHPTSRTGCQSRCKPCDNAKRMGNYRRGNSDVQVDAIRRADGTIALVRRSRPMVQSGGTPEGSNG